MPGQYVKLQKTCKSRPKLPESKRSSANQISRISIGNERDSVTASNNAKQKIGKGNEEQIARSPHGKPKMSEERKGNEGKQFRNELMKEICSLFEAFPVFVFLSSDISNYNKLFAESDCIPESTAARSPSSDEPNAPA